MDSSRRDFLHYGLAAGLGAAVHGGPLGGVPDMAGVPDPSAFGTAAGYRSVKEFGARGDGITDDTAAFTAAISSGEPLLVPAGSYLITAPLPALRSQTLMQGIGMRSAIVYRGKGFVFDTVPESDLIQLSGLAIFVSENDSGAIHLRNTHYARLTDLWLFGTSHAGGEGQVGIMVDSAFPPGGYWANGANIFMRRLEQGFRIVNGANATNWQNVTIRDTILPVNVQSGYGFQLIGGFIEGWGVGDGRRIPAIHAGDDSGVILGVVFEESKPQGYIVEFGEGVQGWVVMGRFNVTQGFSYGAGGRNLLLDTYSHRDGSFLTRGGGTERPGNPQLYEVFFDGNLGKPIWWNGSAWIDALGAVVT